MFFIARVTKWDTTRDCDYRIAPLDKGYRDIVLNTNRMNRVSDIDGSSCEFHYFDNQKDSADSIGHITCSNTVGSVVTAMGGSTTVKTITLQIHKNNSPAKPTTNTTIRLEDIAYADRYNPAPTGYSWIVYYDLSFQRKRVLVPLSIEEIADITTEWGDEQYLIYGDEYRLWRKGVRDGEFVLDKIITPTGFDGIEDTDWENIKSVS